MTHYVVFATDRPECLHLRERARLKHRLFLRDPGQHAVRVLLGGPTLDESGKRMNGTMLVVEANSIDEISRFVSDDPYSKAGLFEMVVIRPWNCGMGRYEAPSDDIQSVRATEPNCNT